MESCRSGLADTRFRIPAATPFPAMERGKNCFPMGEFSHVTAQDSCDMRDRLLRYFATCGQEKPLSGSLKRGEKNA